MKILKQPTLYQWKLSKKGATIDFDIIIAYVIFISTVMLLVNYSLGLTAPFSTSIISINREKSTLALRDSIKTNFQLSNFSDLCNVNQLNLRRFSLTYEIKGFEMPFTDSSNNSPAYYNGSVVFQRNGDSLHVLTGSNSTNESITVEVLTTSDASVINQSLETGDSFNLAYDDFDNLIITLNSKVSEGDVDEIIIKPVSGLTSFMINGASLNQSFIDDIPISNYCGTRGITGPRTSFNRYGLIVTDRTNYPVTLVGDAWWIE